MDVLSGHQPNGAPLSVKCGARTPVQGVSCVEGHNMRRGDVTDQGRWRQLGAYALVVGCSVVLGSGLLMHGPVAEGLQRSWAALDTPGAPLAGLSILSDIPGAGGATSAAVPGAAPEQTRPGGLAPAGEVQTTFAQTLGRAQQLTGYLYGGALPGVWSAFDPKVRAQWKNFAAFEAARLAQLRAYGNETAVVREVLTQRGGLTYYLRTATFERGSRAGRTVVLGLNKAGQVEEFTIVGAQALPQRLRVLAGL